MRLYPVEVDGKYGFVDKDSKIYEIRPQFDYSYMFFNGLAKIKESFKYGYINEHAKYIVRPIYDDAGDFSEGLAVVKSGGKYGYINTKGEVVVPIRFDYGESFSEGMAKVKIGELWGFVDTEGRTVIPPKYESAGQFSDGLASIGVISVFGNKIYGYIDKKGKTVIKPKYQMAGNFSSGLALVNDGSWYYINKKGHKAFKHPPFQKMEGFSEGVAVVGVNHDGDWRYGYIDIKGKFAIKPFFDYASGFHEGMAVIKYSDVPKSLAISTFENLILARIVESRDRVTVGHFYRLNRDRGSYELIEPITRSQKHELKEILHKIGYKIGKLKYGYINRMGHIVIEPKFDYAERFYGELARVRIGSKSGYVNKEGEYIIDPTL